MTAALRLAEPLAALSLATDLGLGQPLEHALRRTRLAVALGMHAGMDDTGLSHVFYVSLLQGLGCVADAHDAFSLLAADDLVLRQKGALLDRQDPRQLLGLIAQEAGSADRPVRRPIYIARALSAGPARVHEGYRAHCEVAALLARRLGVPEPVPLALLGAFERWDGRGPNGTRGDAIPLATRVVEIARLADVHFNARGSAQAVEAVRHERGRSLDPELTDAFLTAATDPGVWNDLRSPTLWADVLELEPPERRLIVDESRLDEVALAFADFADLKSPWTLGHGRRTARIAAEAAEALGLPAGEITATHRAALLQDLGRVGLPNTILEAPRHLGPGEMERVRLHAYYSERILARAPAFANVALLAGAHHERLDGSGYHRGSRAAQLTIGQRILQVADAYAAITAARPYRAALSAEAAARALAQDARSGQLDPNTVRAVTDAARGVRSRAPRHTDLSERELEVLRLAVRGHTRRQIGERLVIAEKTVGHHLEHIYRKLDVSTRAAAVLEAVARGLVDVEAGRADDQ